MFLFPNRILKFTSFLFIFIFLIFPSNSPAILYNNTFQLDDEGRHEFSFEIDPYYSNIAYAFSLTDKPIPRESYTGEWDIYYFLLKNFYLPRYVLFEASVYPLPIAGVYVKKEQGEFYENARITDNINAVKAITTGFPEPWAASFFLGNVANFVKSSNESKIVGRGYSGFLLSYGNRHIVDNIMVKDNWIETEVKLIGYDVRRARDISWSYAIGYKKHFNEEIKDALYISIKRNRVDYVSEGGNPLINFFKKNSEQEIRINFDPYRLNRGKITRYFFLFGKKLVFPDSKTAFSFGIGALKTMASGYSGSLEQDIDEHWSLIFRPNIHIKF